MIKFYLSHTVATWFILLTPNLVCFSKKISLFLLLRRGNLGLQWNVWILVKYVGFKPLYGLYKIISAPLNMCES